MQRHLLVLAGSVAESERVGDEVELNLEQGTVREGHGRGGESARGDVERNIPPVVLHGGEAQTGLADDLRVKVERVCGIAPLIPVQFRPGTGGGLR